MKFRKDLNGLRAIAVVGVVIFHFIRNALPGGFAGVDVFFVISGFLMTSIIFSGLDRGTFRILGFYLARARRIIPALAVLCLFLVAAGFFYLHPLDYKNLAKHVFGSLTFSSNFAYLKESGYFDEASQEKWLLHTWSLSVEWQFYMLYPLVLVFLGKVLAIARLRYILALLTVAAFFASVYLSRSAPDAAFYLLPARAWEMLVGGLAYLFPIRLSYRAGRWLEAVGALLIIVAYFSLSESDVWPGYLALLPAAGAMAVIASHREDSLLTGNRISQWIGTASYSIYLWHWPLVVLLNYLDKTTEPSYMAAAITLSFVLGGLSYFFVERQRFRRKGDARLFSLADLPLGVTYATAIALSGGVYLKNGFDSRLDEQYRATVRNHIMADRRNGYCFYNLNKDRSISVSDKGLQCLLGDRTKPVRTLLFGDSFAGHYEPFWDAVGKAEGIAINAITTNWCFPSISEAFNGPATHPSAQQCRLNRNYLRNSAAEYDVVIFSGMWNSVLNVGLIDDVINAVDETSKKVRLVIIMPSPVVYDTNVYKRFERDLFYHKPFDLSGYQSTRDTSARKVHDLFRRLAAQSRNVVFVERENLFPASGVYTKAELSIPFSLDGRHITVEGSLELARVFLASDFYRTQLKNRLTKP